MKTMGDDLVQETQLTIARDASDSVAQSPKQWTKFEEDGETRLNMEAKMDKENNRVATLEPSQTLQLMNAVSYESSSGAQTAASPAGLTAQGVGGGGGSGGGSETPSSRSGSVSPLQVSKLPPPPAATPRKSQLVATIDKSDTSHSAKAESPSTSSSPTSTPTGITSSQLQSIPLREIASSHSITSQKSFSNGDIIVSLLPLNTHCAWTTPAVFKPELVPEELMAQGLRLTVEDYVTAMQILVNDYRFNLYIIFYKRILVVWIALGFFVLLSLLFSGAKGLALFGGGVLWLMINAVGIFISMWTKLKLYRMLERCIARVNELLFKNNVLVGVDDRGKLSCHKVNLVFIYFDVSYCIKYLNDMLENENCTREQSSSENVPKSTSISFSRNDIDASDIIITGTSPTRLSRKEKYGEKLLLRYSQRWVKEFVRSRIDLTLPLHGDGSGQLGQPLPPRHCSKNRCPCQFIEEHLKFKPTARFSLSELF